MGSKKAKKTKEEDQRKESKRGKKGGKGKKKNLKEKKSKKGKKTKTGKKSKTNRRNKKKQRNNEKLFCCCNKDTGEKICKKDDTKICLAGFIVCDKPDKPPTPAPTPICSPTPTSCPPTCTLDLAQKMKDLKKVSNWIKQYKRLATFLKRVSNKKGKSNNFVNASMALESATMNGTMCGTGGPDPDANAAFNTLKACQTDIEAACMCNVTAPNNTCEADLQNIFDAMTNCTNQPEAQICSCFAAIPTPNAACNPKAELDGATACNNACQASWSNCSSALKAAGPLVDKCKCDCVKTTTPTTVVTPSVAGRRLFLNLRNFHNNKIN